MDYELIGYHGTAYQNLNKIISAGFTSYERSDHWLGQGIYFYEDPDLAVWWGEQKKIYAVIKVKIEVSATHFLDLDSCKGMDYFIRESKIIFDDFDFGVSLDIENPYKNLCFILIC